MSDFNKDRRDFIKNMAVIGAGVALNSVMGNSMISSAFASTGISGAKVPKLVFVLLRGGADALSLVTPAAGSPEHTLYKSRRPTFGLGSSELLSLNADFSINKKLAGLRGLYQNGEMSVVHGVGSVNQSRSHFEQWALIERGVDNRGSIPKTGFLGRLANLSGAQGILSAYAVTPQIPVVLGGAQQGRAATNIQDLLKTGIRNPGNTQGTMNGLSMREIIGAIFGFSGAVSRSALDLVGEVERIGANQFADLTAIEGEGGYGSTNLGRNLRETASLLAASTGPQVVVVNSAGWDMHYNLESGIAAKAQEVNDALSAFVEDLRRKNIFQDTCVVVMSEFGRPLKENNDAGLDHGRGGVMFLLSGALKQKNAGGMGGAVVTRDWGLDRLQDGRDIRVEIDFREVLSEVFLAGWGMESAKVNGSADAVANSAVFPNFTPSNKIVEGLSSGSTKKIKGNLFV